MDKRKVKTLLEVLTDNSSNFKGTEEFIKESLEEMLSQE